MEQIIWQIEGEELVVTLEQEAAPHGLWVASAEVGRWGATIVSHDRGRALSRLEASVRDWLAVAQLSPQEATRWLNTSPAPPLLMEPEPDNDPAWD